MSGFLDSKSRIMDTIVTLEGRSQISVGKLKAAFYSFSDAGAFYIQDTSISGARDASNRSYLEACSLPQDMITLQADDSGKLFKFPGNTTKILNGQVLIQLTGSGDASGSFGVQYGPATGAAFTSQITGVLGSSMSNFTKLYAIGSPDLFDENRTQFTLNTNTATFQITNDAPIPTNKNHIGSLDKINALFQDKRMSHLPNFMFLPPTNMPDPGGTVGTSLGSYANTNSPPILSIDDVYADAQKSINSGYSTEIDFVDTSRTNNLVCQMFELGNGEVIKLDVIDFGLFDSTNSNITVDERIRAEIDPRVRIDATQHVFFCGKVFTDSNNVNKFVSLFTLIFKS